MRTTTLLLLVATLLGAGAAQAAEPNFTGRADGNAVVSFDVFLPLRNSAALDQLLEDQQNPASAQYHRWLSPGEFKARFGADAATVASVHGALEAAGLAVEEHAQSLRATGPVAAAETVLGTSLGIARRDDGGSEIGAMTGMSLAPALQAAHARVVAFDVRRPRKHIHAARVDLDPAQAKNLSILGPDGPYWFTDLKQAYDYPSATAKIDHQLALGDGITIGIVMSSAVLQSDLDTYFETNKYTAISSLPAPTVKIKNVFGGTPFNPKSGGAFEASLDVQQSSGGAPQAQVILYNLPSLSDAAILAGYTDAVEENKVDVVSSSFGECELLYSAAYNNGQDEYGILDTFDDLFKQGNAQGITWLASSGDSGGLGCPPAAYFLGQPGPFAFGIGVETPGASPYVTSVGGTNLVTKSTGSQNSKYVKENGDGDPEKPYDPYGQGAKVSGGYWGAGGGISLHSPKPSYQNLVPTGAVTRTVPDIGMQVGGCPAGISKLPCGPNRSAVFEILNGKPVGVIGTSVSSPEFAGLVALLIQKEGRQGNLNTYIYTQAAAQNADPNNPAVQFYHRKIPGFDGAYHTDFQIQPYNFITGNGTPDARLWLGVPNLKAAGNPQTPSNP